MIIAARPAGDDDDTCSGVETRIRVLMLVVVVSSQAEVETQEGEAQRPAGLGPL